MKIAAKNIKPDMEIINPDGTLWGKVYAKVTFAEKGGASGESPFSIRIHSYEGLKIENLGYEDELNIVVNKDDLKGPSYIHEGF